MTHFIVGSAVVAAFLASMIVAYNVRIRTEDFTARVMTIVACGCGSWWVIYGTMFIADTIFERSFLFSAERWEFETFPFWFAIAIAFWTMVLLGMKQDDMK
jgi:H+/gluconate symporter-like permease